VSIDRVLVANRGEIAVRIVRACRSLGIESVVAVSEADKGSLAAQHADRAVCIGPARASDSYLNHEALLAAALGVGADAIHPGYGFLSENPAFSDACESHGMTFVGPRGETIRRMGNKLAAREVAERYGVPVVPGSGHITGYEDAVKIAGDIGYPVLFKAAAGGGGRGIRIVHGPGELRSTFEHASAEAAAAFGDGTLYLERYVATARHVEVQVFADRHGNVVHLGERDCSMQRRYQKIVEEAPAALISDEARSAIRESAAVLTKGIDYENAGTVEFIYDEDRDEYYFLEMNTRIQVEHPVTEEITGLDLVGTQLQVAAGDPLPVTQDEVRFTGHAIQCRITAESPENDFRPAPGRIVDWQPPAVPGCRVDTHCFDGYLVPPFYDSLLAKVIVHGRDRAQATDRMQEALRRFKITGIDSNIDFLAFLTAHPDFREGRFDTRWVERNLDMFQPNGTVDR
jgi:acetyl-CoA carboxylase biotin carboxylase subunit